LRRWGLSSWSLRENAGALRPGSAEGIGILRGKSGRDEKSGNDDPEPTTMG
jgi:hypothetical protein